MHIRVTTDPITQHEVPEPEQHPCLYEGDGDDGLEIYFEDEVSRSAYMAWNHEYDEDHHIALKGNDSDDYVAEG